MKSCNKCNITINTNKNHCPLCYAELEEENKTSHFPYFSTKQKEEKIVKKNVLLFKIMLFLSICAIFVCFFVNFIINKKVLWSIIVFLAIIYIWILIRHTIMSKRNVFEKVLFQFVGILAIILSSNLISGGGDWFWNFVVPSASMLTTTVMILFSLVNKKRNDFILSIFVLTFILLILNIILRFANIDSFKLISEINILYNSLALVGILILDFKAIKNSISKNFHI